jgi:4a-hydroxytetrahydrobiopterin dehydratase
MVALLSSEDLANRITDLDGWEGDTTGIRRAYKAPDFLTGIRLVSAVAEAAESMNHHPDIDIRWRTVSFALSTHSEGGVTELDLDLAGRIDALARELKAE